MGTQRAQFRQDFGLNSLESRASDCSMGMSFGEKSVHPSCYSGFALPPVVRLKDVPPLRALRRDLLPLPSRAWLVYGAALGAIVAVMWRYTDSLPLTLSVLAVTTALAVLLGLLLRNQ